MKRTLIILLALGLITGSLSMSATAKKKKKKAKPVKTVLYFHGNETVGETESMVQVSDVPLPMSPAKPTGSEPKSKQMLNGVATPNSDCAGNNMFVNWSGKTAGTIKGDVKVTFNAVSSPGSVLVRLWPDVLTSLCTSTAAGTNDYPKPAGEAVVALPNGPGEVTAVLKNVNVKAFDSLLVQFSPAYVEGPEGRKVFPPSFARFVYDTPDFDSRIEFMCIPAKGKKCAS